MPPRGNRLVCTLRTADGAQAIYDVHAGEQPGGVGKIDPVKWNKASDKPVVSASFVIIGDLGLTGKAHQLKVVEDALRMLKRAK